jgi:hypothetical protein
MTEKLGKELERQNTSTIVARESYLKRDVR